MFKTIISTLPPMLSFYDPYLLNPLLGILMRVENKIIPLSQKKIRIQDTGKKREFDKLLIQFRETYERKKIEKEEYEEKIKNAPKRPGIPVKGTTMRFKKFQSTEQTA